MRLKTLQCSMLIAAAIPSAMLPAQFIKPSSEELSMTAEPKAPGADAVFLNVEETTNDTLHVYDVYERIKILTEKERELKNVDISYHVGEFGATDVKPQYLGMYGEAENGPSNPVRRQNGSTVAAPSVLKVVAVKARTIHSDGTIFPLTVKPEYLLRTKSSDGRLQHLSFTLPSVEVGSIVEYLYTIQYDDKHFSSPSWQIQHPYFNRKAHYRFTPFKEFLKDEQGATNRYLVDAQGKTVSTLIWWPVLPAGAAVRSDPLGVLSLDLSDIPPAPSEDWMPPVNVASYHVNFYYLAALNRADFWTDQQRLWSKQRTGDITFSDRTNFTGYFRFILTGQDALYWRQLTLANGADEVKKQFDSWLASLVPAGSSATLDHFLGADDAEHNLVAVVNAQGALPASVQNHPTLPAFFFEASSHQPFEDKPQRQQPVDTHYGQQVIDQITYHLPPTLSVQTAPANENVAMGHYATFTTNVKIEAEQIIMTRSLARKFTIVKPLDYSDLRNFYAKFAEADRKQIVLAESKAASN